MRKSLISCLWFGQHVKPPIHSRSGEEIEIAYPGNWNTRSEHGPHFENSKIINEDGSVMECNVYIAVSLSDIDTDLIFDEHPLFVVMFDDTRKEFNEPVIVMEENMEKEVVENYIDMFSAP